MEFYIKKNSTLPVLKLEVIKDGRSDFNYNSFLSGGTTFLMSLYDKSEDRFLFASKECFITSEFSPFEGKTLYYLNYQFSNKDTKRVGRYEVQISIPSPEGVILLPLQDKYYVNIIDSFAGDFITYNSNFLSNIPCCSQSFTQSIIFNGLNLEAYYNSGSLNIQYVLSSTTLLNSSITVNFSNTLSVLSGNNLTINTGVTINAGQYTGVTNVVFSDFDFTNLLGISIFSNVIIDNVPSNVLSNFNESNVFNFPSPTPTSTLTPTITSTNTQTPTVTQSLTITPTPSVTITQTNIETSTPTPSMTETPTPTNTTTISQTVSPTSTESSTPTPTPSITETPSPTPTITPTNTPTATENSIPETPTPTVTETPTPTPTNTETPTTTPTNTQTPTMTETPTPTPTNTPTTTETPTPTPTETITPSPTLTPSVTPAAVTSTTYVYNISISCTCDDRVIYSDSNIFSLGTYYSDINLTTLYPDGVIYYNGNEYVISSGIITPGVYNCGLLYCDTLCNSYTNYEISNNSYSQLEISCTFNSCSGFTVTAPPLTLVYVNSNSVPITNP